MQRKRKKRAVRGKGRFDFNTKGCSFQPRTRGEKRGVNCHVVFNPEYRENGWFRIGNRAPLLRER